MKFEKLEEKLKYFGNNSDCQNVPVGISVTTGGKFIVKFSLYAWPKMFDTFAEAAEYIEKFE